MNASCIGWKKWMILLLAGLLLLSGCDKDDSVSPQSPPVIPPKSTFLIDFNAFPDSTQAVALSKGDSRSHWRHAATHILVWNSVLTITLIVPVTAFVASFGQDPQPQPDGSWLWSYSFEVLGVSHTAELLARLDGERVAWEMRISKEDAYTDFLWYTGRSNLTATEGEWTLYLSPEDPRQFLQIDWHRDPANGSGDIKYTNILPDAPQNGSFIFHGITTQTPYDAFYIIFDSLSNNSIDIEWNRTLKNGRVKNPLHFHDELWHCWDEQLMDIVCP